jgi:hypothetical protein
MAAISVCVPTIVATGRRELALGARACIVTGRHIFPGYGDHIADVAVPAFFDDQVTPGQGMIARERSDVIPDRVSVLH